MEAQGRAARCRAALDALTELAGEVEKPRMEVQQLRFLLALAAVGAEGATMTAMAEHLACDLSAVSRNTKAFGRAVLSRPLVDQRIDPNMRKFRVIALTDHGRQVVDRLLERLGG